MGRANYQLTSIRSRQLNPKCAKETIRYPFLTTKPNNLFATVDPSRMPVMIVGADAQAAWLEESDEEARNLIASYSAEQMALVQAGIDRSDLG